MKLYKAMLTSSKCEGEMLNKRPLVYFAATAISVHPLLVQCNFSLSQSTHLPNVIFISKYETLTVTANNSTHTVDHRMHVQRKRENGMSISE